MNKVRQIRRGTIMNRFKCVKNDAIVNPEQHRQPVKLLQHRGNVMRGRGFGDNTGGRILNHLKFLKGFVSKTKKERVTVIKM